MKKIAIILLVIFLLTSAFGCASPTTDNDNKTESTVNTTGAPVTPNNENVGCQVDYYFYSIKDLETYILTGSKNPADYSRDPSPGFSFLPSNGLLKNYISPSVLGIDENLFLSSAASFKFGDNGNIIYNFYLDGILIIIEETDVETTEQYLSRFYSEFTSDKLTAYQNNISLKNGYVKRQYNNIDLIYKMENNTRRIATFLIDGFSVSINSTFRSNANTMVQDYQAFLTSPKTATIAALFSDDPEVFQNIINNIKNSFVKE